MIYGRFQTYKSFYAVSMALAIATGKPFLGEFEAKPGKVAYIISEGVDSFEKRLWAWCKHYGVDMDSPTASRSSEPSGLYPGSTTRRAIAEPDYSFFVFRGDRILP